MTEGRTQNLGKDIVALVAMIAAAGWAGWLLARQSLDIGATWSDGEGSVSSISGDAVRHAIWDEAQELGGGVNGTDREGRPAISPDGRLLVFSVGERGLNAELWVADLDGQRVYDPRPLTKLNTAADELAPAFGSDALWFASDRGGENYGLDLWRVPYGDGHFGTPESAGAGINSSADDTDPFPVPGTRALAFASNRARGARTDFDLFGALPRETRDAEGNRIDDPESANETWVVGTLAALNTPFEEREPALTPDGRALLFASDRAGANNGPGGSRSFDLYRSFRTADGGPGEWLEPRPLIGLNTQASERAPLPTDGGFALLFQRAAGSDGGNILRAHSRELFQLPQAPLSLTELLILILLVTIGILAILAKRWRAIDVLYKCLLVSVLAHLLLLLWFREVVPETEQVATQDVERAFRVRLAVESGGTLSSLQERSGELAAERATVAESSATPARTELQADLENSTDAAPTSSESLDTSSAPADSAPQATRLESNESAAEHKSAPAEVAAPERLSPEYSDDAPSLAHAATQGDQVPNQRSEASAPTATSQADTLLTSAAARPSSGGTIVTTRARGNDAASAPQRQSTVTPTATTGTLERELTQVTGPAPIEAEQVGDVAQMSLGALDGAQQNNERESLGGQSPELRTDQPVLASSPEAAAPALGEAVQPARQDLSEGATETGNRRRMTGAGERGRGETALATPTTLGAIDGGEGAAGNPAATRIEAGALAIVERASEGRAQGPGRPSKSSSVESNEPLLATPRPNETQIQRREQSGPQDDGPQRQSLSAAQRGSSTPTSELRTLEVADSGASPAESSDEGRAELALRPAESTATRQARTASGPGRPSSSNSVESSEPSLATPSSNGTQIERREQGGPQDDGPQRQALSAAQRGSSAPTSELRTLEVADSGASPAESSDEGRAELALSPAASTATRQERTASGPGRAGNPNNVESSEPLLATPRPNGTQIERREQRGQQDDGPQRQALSAAQRGSSTPISELRTLEVADSGAAPSESSDEGRAELALRPAASTATRQERTASGPGRTALAEAPMEGSTGTLTPQDNSPAMDSPRPSREQLSGPRRQSLTGPERGPLSATADLRAPGAGAGGTAELAATSTQPGEPSELEINPSVASPTRRTREVNGPQRRSLGDSERVATTGIVPVPQAQPLLAAAPPTEEIDDAPRRSREQNAYSNRFGDARLRALEEFGGGADTERAVALGLQYLASKQNENGSWGSRRDFDRDKYRDVRIGKSGLALLAFMGAGHLPGGSTEYAPVSAKAVAYLKGLVSERTGHMGDGASYSHAIATYALAECFALTEDESLRAPLERAIARILVAQNQRDDPRHFGGWGYYFSDGSVWEDDRWPRVSVTAWQVMALESARLAGLEVPDESFDAARRFLANAWDSERGAFRYSHNPQRLRSGYPILPASTPAALFGLSLLGVDLESPDLRPAWDFVSRRRPQEYRNRGDDAFVFDAKGNIYFWYYGTLASFRRGGSTWERWNIAMQETLLPAQNEDGSWQQISTYSRYAGDTDRDRTYSTAINVLSLEVYYRYFTPLLQVR